MLKMKYLFSLKKYLFSLKVSAKNYDRYPPANAVLCLHLDNSTSELCRDTWLSWALT